MAARDIDLRVVLVFMLATGIFGGAPAPVLGQAPAIPVARPGDGTMDGSRIHPYTNIWNVYRVHDDGRENLLSTWWDTLTVGEVGGPRMLRRVQHVRRAAGGERYLLNEVDAKTLAPIRSLDVTRGDTMFALDFHGRRIQGRRRFVPHNGTPGDAVLATVDITLPQPVFDWQIWGTLVTALPLRKGYAVRFLAHIASPAAPGPFIWITTRVVGSAMVKGAGGQPVDTWVVDTDGMVKWRFWIAKKPDIPPIVQIRIPTPDPTVANWWRSEAKPGVPVGR